MAGVTNRQLLNAIESLRDKDLAEIKNDLERFNGRIRFTEQSVASLVTWRKDHQDGFCATTTKEIESLRSKTNTVGTILAVGQIIIAAIGAALFGNKGP